MLRSFHKRGGALPTSAAKAAVRNMDPLFGLCWRGAASSRDLVQTHKQTNNSSNNGDNMFLFNLPFALQFYFTFIKVLLEYNPELIPRIEMAAARGKAAEVAA